MIHVNLRPVTVKDFERHTQFQMRWHLYPKAFERLKSYLCQEMQAGYINIEELLRLDTND